MDEEVLLKNLNGFFRCFGMIFDALLVVRVSSNQWTEPSTEAAEDLGIGERHPTDDGGIVLLRLAEKRCLLVLGGNCILVSVLH